MMISKPYTKNGIIAGAYKNVIIKESGNTVKLYRGMDSEYVGTDGLRDNGHLWTTMDAGYAKVYAVDKKNPAIVEYVFDKSKSEIATLEDLDDMFGYVVEPCMILDGLDDTDQERLLTNGYDGFCFNREGHEIVVLLNMRGVVSKRTLSKEEYKAIELSE